MQKNKHTENPVSIIGFFGPYTIDTNKSTKQILRHTHLTSRKVQSKNVKNRYAKKVINAIHTKTPKQAKPEVV